MDAPRVWVAALPDRLERQRTILGRLVETVAADERIRALRIGGSIARGTADDHSDLDTRVWLLDGQYDAALADLPALIRSVAEPLDVLFDTADLPYLFVQYTNGVQLEMSIERASDADGRLADWVVLLDRDGLLDHERPRPDAWDRGLWQDFAWMKLSDADKYLRRGSIWEALTALEEARARLVRHHADAIGTRDPQFGFTSIVDYGGTVPPGLERTVAGLDADEIRAAALACAELLAGYGRRPFGDDVLHRLASR